MKKPILCLVYITVLREWLCPHKGLLNIALLYFSIDSHTTKLKYILEMSANAQRDGRPAEYRWHPLFNAAKFG